MLEITLKPVQYIDDTTNQFVTLKEERIALEHSLVSLSKWESVYKKPFISETPKTDEETLYYIACMNLAPNIFDFTRLTPEHLNLINAYIEDPMSATTITSTKKKKSKEVLTSEILYASMVELQIPFECQYWHLNRLIKLIEVVVTRSGPKDKVPKREIIEDYKALNAKRRAEMKSRG